MPPELPADAPETPLATREARDAHLDAAFAFRNPGLIADAVIRQPVIWATLGFPASWRAQARST
jgi:hypothetical protein